ncbi:hypothetical protein GCM10017764_33930 [Sphingobacterium griseoflavum]|uniref:Uncharacterized protein n=2 Tax=Sphingobacterium griseoflavum TaxID=1474952 RepID=A0ABQ3HYN1_9SPHI|nr:hypothetical protein GCM10017764_33930 [Sphingobacterium griseoflavum]
MRSSALYPRILPEQVKQETQQDIRYNFAFGQDSTRTHNIHIPVKTVGFLSNEIRPVAVRIVDEDAATTAIEGTDFRLLPTVIGANQFEGNIQVVLLRNPRIAQEEKQVTVELMTNAFFPRYLYLDSVNVYKRAKITFVDIFRKPDEWDGIFSGSTFFAGYGLGRQFGPYSEAKFRLVIDVFGTAIIIPFTRARTLINNPVKPPGYFSEDQWRNLIIVLQQRLIDFEAANGEPMRDENGDVIRIPDFNVIF